MNISSFKWLFVLYFSLIGVSGTAQKVGLLLGSYVSSRWYLDQKLFVDRLSGLGITCAVKIAYDPDEQLEQAGELIEAGAEVLVIVPLDAGKAASIVRIAKYAGVPVISYDRLILSNELAVYLSYDNLKVGKLQAQYMLSKVPRGDYLLINGPISDNNAILFREGQMQVLRPHIESGDIRIVDDIVLDKWSQMESFEKVTLHYKSDRKKPDVILAANDALANGVIKALPSEYTGKVYISGQDADLAGIRNIIAGHQTMTVYKPIKPLAYLAAEKAEELLNRQELTAGMVRHSDSISVPTILMEPVVVDKNNYRETILKDGHASLLEVVNNLGEAFEQERNKIRLTLLEKEKALEVEKKINQRNTFIIILIFFLLSVMGLSYTIYQKQRDNKLLNKQKKIIQGKNEELNQTNKTLRAYNDELTQHQEEISAQRDAIALQNQKLEEVKTIIEQQRDEIMRQNETLEAEVRKRTGELVQYVQQLEEYAFITAHKLRAPVARITGLGQLIEKKQSNPEEVKFILEKLSAASEELGLIFDDLNAVLDIRTFSMEVFTEVDIMEEIDYVKANLKAEIKRHNVIIKPELSYVKTIFSIQPYIQSILFNLISNSIKYRHADRQLEVKVRTELVDDKVCLSVSDNGIGIAAPDIESMFQLYQRHHFHVEGRGIGLFLVKTQMDALGGEIKVKSRVGKGTTLEFYLKQTADTSTIKEAKKTITI
ncbi:substrate-binding domain-containing protein [Fulvivirga ulvae]|uniref:sensor histidine kinase n=1 Tax=Fulvivirga ulvae TaxID=2904245 RepID=UPI001F46D170|nr:sensor histidine kinase [Fulvivirga ulvae]UII31278.1 substrate-binding domain-containing protein [Fulvivirga ulvae]